MQQHNLHCHTLKGALQGVCRVRYSVCVGRATVCVVGFGIKRPTKSLNNEKAK